MRRLLSVSPLALSLFVVAPLPLLGQVSRTGGEPNIERVKEGTADAVETGEAARLREVPSRGAGGFGGRGGQPGDRGSVDRGNIGRVPGAGKEAVSEPTSPTAEDLRVQFTRAMEERRNAERAAATALKAERRTTVVSMRYAPAAEVAETLGRALGNRRDVTVVSEPISNTLLVSAPEAGFERTTGTVLDLVRTLDRAPQMLSIEVAIVDLHDVEHVTGPFEGSLADLLEDWRKKGISAVEHVSLATLEGQKTSVQFGESRAVPSGQSQGFAGRSGVPTRITQYQQREFGTIVQLTGRVSGDEVVMEFTVERTKVGEIAPPQEEVAESSPPPETRMLNVRSTIRAAAGEVVLVGSRGIGGQVVAVLASVRVAGVRGEESANGTGRSGRGAVRDDRGAAGPAPEGARELKIFTLQYAEASAVAGVLREVLDPRRSSLNVGVDNRTNSLVVAGDEASLQTVEALIARLDQSESSR